MKTNKARAKVKTIDHMRLAFFHVETREEARQMSVNGWIRTNRDGRIEAVFEGLTDNVEKMIEWFHGRLFAEQAIPVPVAIERGGYRGRYGSFSIRP